MEWLTVSNCINALLVVVGWTIRNELHHIRESIKAVKELTSEAKSIALRAHERIDQILLDN